MHILVPFLVVGAIARLTRLITRDVLLQPLRDWADRRWGEASRPAYLLSCTWCASIWVAFPVVVSAALWGGTAVWQVIAAALTASYLVSLIALHFDE